MAMRGIRLIRLRIWIIGEPCEYGIEPSDFIGDVVSSSAHPETTPTARSFCFALGWDHIWPLIHVQGNMLTLTHRNL